MDNLIARVQKLEQTQDQLYDEFKIVTRGVALLTQEFEKLARWIKETK